VTPNPLNRLRQYPQTPEAQPAPQGLQLGWIPGVGDEAGGEQQGGGMNDVGALLGQYLKGRQALKGGGMAGVEGKS
jgi:hypothetical protein